jgi:membrane-associated phospholipid phosphatase
VSRQPCLGSPARALLASLLALALLFWSVPALAMEAEVAWNPAWPRFRKAEVAFTGGLTLQVAAALFVYPTPRRKWEGGVLFDDVVRDLLVLRSLKARNTAARVSDYLYYGLAVLPMALDAGIVAGGVHGSGDVAVQMLAMDLESYALAGAIALSAEKLGRVRPADRGCRSDSGYSRRCGDEAQLNVSFMSGHTTIAFTGAGLTCAHHSNLPLYGGGVPDIMACVVSLVAAATSGTLRIASDAHYATDVLLGAGVGLFAGYGLPELLHYRDSRSGAPRRKSLLPTFRSAGGEVTAVVAPSFAAGRAGFVLAGTF